MKRERPNYPRRARQQKARQGKQKEKRKHKQLAIPVAADTSQGPQVFEFLWRSICTKHDRSRFRKNKKNCVCALFPRVPKLLNMFSNWGRARRRHSSFLGQKTSSTTVGQKTEFQTNLVQRLAADEFMFFFTLRQGTACFKKKSNDAMPLRNSCFCSCSRDTLVFKKTVNSERSWNQWRLLIRTLVWEKYEV